MTTVMCLPHDDPSNARRGTVLGWILALCLVSTGGCNTFSGVHAFESDDTALDLSDDQVDPGDTEPPDPDVVDTTEPPGDVDATDTVAPPDTTVPPDTDDASDTVDATVCADVDGDLHGDGCAAGFDCDDTDSSTYEGAAELCDAVDNDCDGFTDEAFPGLNESCPVGHNRGALACTADNQGTLCCAPREACDGVDNDCDGFIDEDSACSMCADDGYSPNHTQAQRKSLARDVHHNDLVLCPDADDFFQIGLAPVVIEVELEQAAGNNAEMAAYADIDIQVYCGGVSCETYQGTTTDFTFDTSTCCTDDDPLVLRVHDAQNDSPDSGTPYTLTLTQLSP